MSETKLASKLNGELPGLAGILLKPLLIPGYLLYSLGQVHNELRPNFSDKAIAYVVALTVEAGKVFVIYPLLYEQAINLYRFLERLG